jgi:hypothetical protein
MLFLTTIASSNKDCGSRGRVPDDENENQEKKKK